MKKYALIFLLMIITIIFINAETKALLIGNGEYEDERIEDLPGALLDVERLGKTLEELEIAVPENIQIKKNLPTTSLRVMIKNFLENETADRKILFYSGHGFSQNISGKNETYLIPSNTIEDFKEEYYVNITKIFKEAIPKIKEQETIIILDSCYSGGILKDKTKTLSGFNTRPKSLIEMIKDTKVNIMVASGAKETALEENEGNGYFTKYLIEGLNGKANEDDNEFIDFGELGEYVKKNVDYASKGTQNPDYHGDGTLIITEVKEQIIENMLRELRLLRKEGSLTYELYRVYVDILDSTELNDNESQKQLRSLLHKYYDDDKRYDSEDLFVLEITSEKFGLETLSVFVRQEVEAEKYKNETNTHKEESDGINEVISVEKKKIQGLEDEIKTLKAEIYQKDKELKQIKAITENRKTSEILPGEEDAVKYKYLLLGEDSLSAGKDIESAEYFLKADLDNLALSDLHKVYERKRELAFQKAIVVLYNEGYQLYKDKKYKEANEEFSSAIKYLSVVNSDYHDDTLYYRALSNYNISKYNVAEKDFDEINSTHQGSSYVQHSLYYLCKILLSQDRKDELKVIANELLKYSTYSDYARNILKEYQ